MIKFFIYIILILTYARQQQTQEKIDKNDTLEMIENKNLIDEFRK